MARPRTFDETLVVGQAARAFSAAGYEATSLDTLVAATGLHRGSLYAAFGSKRGLFLAALQLAEAGGLTDEEMMDLLLVALVEVAPTDATVRAAAHRRVGHLAPPAALTLGTRLLQRAGLHAPDPDDLGGI